MNLQNIEAIYPLSPFQASLLSGDLRTLDRSAYCGQMICSLHGELDTEAFERAWRLIIDLHPILRTMFAWENLEKPVQLVHRQIDFSLLPHDWRGLSPEQQQELLDTLLEAERETGFHATQAPLMRLCLCRLSNDDYYLLWSYDLLVLDNWSLPLLLEKAIAVYAGQLKGEMPQVEQGRLYQDYIAWLKEQDVAQAEAFWKESLNGSNGSENLNGLFRSTPETTNGYAHIQLPSGLTASLRALASEHQLDFQALVQGAWALLLSRYSGENEIVYGATVSGRPADLTGSSLMVGPFSNVLPVHVRVSSSTPVVSWLKSLSAHLDDLRKYSFYPGGASHLPAFVSTVQTESSPTNGLLHENGSALRVREIQPVEQTKSPLMLIAPSQSEAALQLSYNPAAFDDASAVRLAQHFENLLTGILQHSQLPISQLSILSAPELDQLLYSFNDTAAPLPQTSIHARFQQQVLQSPNAVALSFLGSSLPYVELDRRSNQLARHLLSLGVSPDSLVAVCLDRSLELFIALLAILKAGAAYLPLDPSYPLSRLSFMLTDAGSPLVLTTDALADELPAQWTQPVLLDADWDLIAQNTDEPLPEKAVATDQLAYVIYTSGSTGTPKGVAVTHGGVLRLVTSPNYVHLDAAQTLLQMAPLTFDASTLEVWGALLNGSRLVVMPPSAPTLDEISDVIVTERVTTLWLTAGLFHLMVDEQLEDLSQVEQLLAGGDVLSVRHVEKYLAAPGTSERRLINGYGPTENTTFTCCYVMDRSTRLSGSVPIGPPITNTQVYVLDAEMQVVPVGVVGELYIGGAGLARGYFNQPKLTAESFVPHLHSTEPGARLYRTGDMVRWHENGELEFIGRVDGQVKVRGFRIEVGEIESVLAGHDGVREAVVLVREDERRDKRLAAYVVKEAESEVTVEELKKYLRERLPEYMQVQWVVAVAEIPLTANGKVDRRALQAVAVEFAGSGEQSVQVRTPAEEILAAIWAEVLGRETIGVHDNFFELGGHSLLATQVISRVRDAFGQEVALRSLFEQPTVAGLAREIEAGRLGVELQAPPLERIERAERLPLSFGQQRLWFLDQMEPGSVAYNIPAAVRLRGVLNVEALERTLSEVMRRHEVLRTRFIAVDGEPVQLIEAAVPIKLEVLDLSALAEEVREAEVQRLGKVELGLPFDLSRGPLLRVSLIRLGAEEHVALVTMHHIVSDGWSIGVFINEVGTLYAAYVRGDESPLEELPIQYADFAHWQRRWLQGEVLAAQLDFWRAELADAPTVIDLPIDNSRPPIQTYHGASYPVELSAELSAQLRDLSRRHGSTLFMTLLAAFDLLLCRYAGQEQVLVGSPIANRNRSETEGLIGFFVNTLVLRGDARGNPSFRELLRRVRETALSAYAHQDLPFEKLVEELQPERDMSRSPLFQVMFVLQNAPGEALELEGLSLSAVESEGESVKFELMLGLEETGEVVLGDINYNCDLYEAETIGRMAASYERVLQAVVADAEQRVFEIDLLSEAERRQIIGGWNETEQEYAPALTLSELFEAQVARAPEAVALRFADTTLSYRELNERANQLAHYLQAKGVGPEVRVGVLLERSVETIVTLLAIFRAGGAYVPLEPEYPDERLRFMVRDAGLELVVTQERLSNRLIDTVAQSLRVDADWVEIANEREDNPPLLAGAANLAYIIYTSGSSGTPKGAMVTRGGMLNCLQWMQQRYELTAQDSFLMHTSLNFDPSVWEVFWPLLVGGRVVIAPAGMLESGTLLEYMAEHSVTCAYFVPSMLGVLVHDSRLSEVSSLRYVISGGEKLPLPVMREFQAQSEAELHHSYGPTETAIAATEWTCEAGAERVLMGRPIANTQAYVLDGEMEPLPVGVAGELYIGGVGVGRGYAGQAGLTAERFVPDWFSAERGARLYRTGDLVRYDGEGKLEFMGRVDQQVKVRGYRIELGEIEAVLAEHEAVRECTVVAAARANGETKLLAYLVARQQLTPSVTELREFLKKKLPEYMIPAAFTALDAIPLMPNGKVDRRALPTPDALSLVLGSGFVAPRTVVEEIVVSIWSQLLGVKRIGVDDNFFTLGGHSLLATQVIARVRDAFGQEVPLRSLFEQPTVAGLAQTIERAQLAGAGLSAPPLVPISRDAELPLSFAQQRLWFLDQLEPNGSFYNLPAAMRLHGVLNVEALERTLSEVVRRHEVLRTRFIVIDGEPVQLIEAAAPIKLEVLDLSALDEAQRTAETQRLVAEESARPFDLSRGRLLRVSLLRLGAEEHAAIVTMHHIISDGWSTGVFIREVAALYSAYVRGEESPLDELPIQYADFAHWQRDWLQGEVLAAQLAYWREVLAEAPVMLELPTDRPRPREQTFNGAIVPVVVPEELTGQLKELGQHERVTLFMTLLAAFQSLLFRHSGQDDIVVGTPIANRRYRELEDLIGFFVNTLALRASSLSTLTFTELLHRVREVTLGAYAHQDLPFEKLVEELQPERDLSRNPLFQVLFAVQNAPSGALELPGLRLEGEDVEDQATRFDLECHIWEVGPALSGVFVYNTDLFEPPTIERLAANYKTLLQSIVANPTEAVASLRLLRAEDERQLLYDWNETWTEFPRDVVTELFAQQVARTPYATAVIFDGMSLTFAELNQRSNLVASYLRSKGVGAETVVGVMLERSVEMLVAVLGVLKAGGAYLPLDPGYPTERLQFMLANAAVSVLLTQESLLGHTGGPNIERVCLDTDWHAIIADAVDENPPTEVTGDNLAFVVYTSGSTGQPKGVALPHRQLVNLLHWQMRRSNPAPRTVQFTSLSFDVSFQEIFSTWCSGGTLVLIREETRRDLGALWMLLIRERIERMFLPFVALQYLAEEAERNGEYPAALREVIAGGEQLKITRHIRSLFANLNGCTLDNHYGPSEVHVISAFRLEGDAAAWPELPAIGRPMPNAQLYLLDERLQVVPIGAAGEVYIGGEMARGYLNRPALTAERFLPHPFVLDGSARLYRSGDQARYLADGNIEFLGRRDQQVKVRGYRIELGEVEAALRQQEQVREAVVVSGQTASVEKRLIAYVLTEKEVTTNVLRDGLKELLPEYMIPAAFVLVQEFPLTPSGKINRRALQARPVEFEAGGASVPARTPAEEIVAAIWAEVLGRETIGVHDNFFELGGHSLLATRVMSRVRDTFGQDVPLRALFEQSTVAGLVQSIEQAQRTGAGLSAPAIVPVSRDTELPLSFAQQRLWFLDQLEPGSSFYNLPVALRLRGVLNVEALEWTLSEVVRRHEVLRTRFVTIDGNPVQLIEPSPGVRLPVTDLSALDEAERSAESQRLVQAESARPFNLTTGPLLRVGLIRLGAEEHVALVTMHHIISDGWSMGVLVREVAALYTAYVHGEESPLEELPIQYADFADWQRSWLQGEVLAAHFDYWRAQLADAPTVIDLPIDKPRPPIQTYRGAYQPLHLSADLSAQLLELSRRHGSTLFMTLLAAFDLLLCRYAGQEQVLVGSPIANRNRSETESLIGFFVNTLVLRGDVRGNPSFRELLRRVRETALSAYAHQDLPFEKLVEELQPERDMSRSPLFQVMFVLQNTPSEALELEGLSLSGVESVGETAKFELNLGLQEVGGIVVGGFNYDRDLYEPETIGRLAASYERVLQAVVADAEQRVFEIALLSDAERRQIVESWNERKLEYAPGLTLSALFEAQAARTPTAVALHFEDTTLSYRELNERANQLARYLQRAGVGPDVLLGLLMDRSVEMIVALLGILKAGGAYVPLDPMYPAERLAFMVQDSGLRLLLTQERWRGLAGPYVSETLSLDQQWDLLAGESVENVESGVQPENLAYVIYTSGSSGTPKGAMVTHGGVVNSLRWKQHRYELSVRDGFLMHTSLNFDPSVWEVFWPLMVGGRVVIAPQDMQESSALLKYMAGQSVTCAYFVPSMLGVLVQDPRLSECRSLRYLINGGEKLPLAVMQEFQRRSKAELIHSYGPTEVTVGATEWACVAGAERVLMGRPIANTQAYVLDTYMEPLPVGVAGELYIGGVGVGRGYAGQAELTAERFVPDRFSSEPGARLYRTGDVVRYDAEGKLEFVGRVDHQVKLRGYRIELGEIETVLRRNKQVREAVVVLSEVDGDKRLVAYVVGDAQAGELRAYLKTQLPEYMVPSFFVRLEELPLLPNGKLDRRALPAPKSIGVEEYQPPRTQTEELLSGLWASVLRVPRVGIRDNFFELGGHSLLATQLVSRVRETFGVELPLRELFARPTVAGLAEQVEAELRGDVRVMAPPVVAVSREQPLPLSHAQERLWFLDQLGSGSVAYNIPAAVRLKGRLDVAALQRTLDEVVRRHEVLRTTFVAVNGEAVQVIAPASQVDLPVLDLSTLPELQRETEARLLVEADAAQPFDLGAGPLLRVRLLQLGAEDHVVLFTMHHIVTDGWSTAILVNEVGALYEAYIEGRESPLPEPEIQYADYAVWQREWLQGEVLEQQLSYWRQQLGEELPVLQLPTDKPRPPVQSYRGRSLGFRLPAPLTAELKQLSNAEGVTLYMTLLAAFKILLCRYSGQSDVVVGTPIAGRNHLATENLIGLFVNTLVLRTSLSGDPSFSELLDRVKEITLGAYAHQDLPFEKLVEELQPERDMSRSPLFQVVFALHNQTTETLQLPGLEANEVGNAPDETAKFDLTMAFIEIDGELNGGLQYSTDLFETSTISRMLEQLERLLASAVSAPEQPISQLELLSSAERDQLLVERNDTHVAYPHSRGIHELFEEQVVNSPEAPALTTLTFQGQGEHVSYAELNSRANQLAHYLRQLGIKSDTPVGVCLLRSVEMVVALLAILKAGGTYVPLDPEHPAERIAFILEDVFPPVILTDSSLVDELPSSWSQMLCLDTESDLWSALPTNDLAGGDSSSDDLAYVMYTSGSTGNPKGVAVPHRAVVRLVKQSAYVDFGPSEVFLQLAPVTFDASTLEIWGALLNGGRLVLMPPGAPNLAELGTVLSSEGVTVLWLTAGLFHLMVEQELESLASVTQVVAGGDVLSTEHVRSLLRAKEGSGVVVNGYGPTETTTFACCHRMSSETELGYGVPIGRPIGNTQVYALSEEMELLGDGMLGELYIGGDGLARGYYNQPGLTADRFVPDPFGATGGERLYRTGDYVSWRADGTLEFIGRRDTQVKIRGFRVEPGEVEAVLGRHGAVKECAVVVRETNGEKRLVAYVVDGNHEGGVNASLLRDYLREQLPEFMLPAAIVAIESLPLTPNGKVDRRELAAREVRVGGDQSFVPPRTINEELLCNIWEEVLGAERVGIDDNFFDLGGDSILTIKVIVKTREIGLELNVQQLFQYQTVHELAQELERSTESPIGVEETAPFSLIAEEDRLRLPAGVVDAYPVTALQAGMLFHTELAPEAGQYHDIFSYHLRMPFDDEALQAALRQLIELHPVLRTSFNLSDFSEPLQLVHEEVEVPLRIEDLRSLTPTEQEESVAEWLAAEKRHHFDWRKAPLLRFQIARRDEESFQFSFSFHHAILDGWSLATMLTELFNVYASVRKGDERRTDAPLSSSFRDFVAAEQAALNSAEARQYWTTMLSEAPHSRLPRLGQSAGPSRVVGHGVGISGELSLALKALARTAGVPLKSVLLAAHLRALSVLTGSNDVLTGMVSHGRPETADSERVLGLFLNTLPFRRQLAGGTWLQLVQETFAAERELLPFRRYPMARMQQDLGHDTPLFEITFNFTHFHAYDEMQHAGSLEVLDMHGVADTNFTLAVDFSLEPVGSQVRLSFHYNTAELSAEQIEAVGRNYLTILESMTREPLERYEQQSLLAAAERQRILYDWNDTREAYDLEKCLQQLSEAL